MMDMLYSVSGNVFQQIADWLFLHLGWGGILSLIAGGLLAMSLSARLVKFLLSRNGMAVTAALLLAGLGIMWYARPAPQSDRTYDSPVMAYQSPITMPGMGMGGLELPGVETEEAEPAQALAFEKPQSDVEIPAVSMIPPDDIQVPALPPQQAPVHSATPIVNQHMGGTMAHKASTPHSSTLSRNVAAAPSPARTTPSNAGAAAGGVSGRTGGVAQGGSSSAGNSGQLSPAQQRLQARWRDYYAGQAGLNQISVQMGRMMPATGGVHPAGGMHIGGMNHVMGGAHPAHHHR